MTMTSSDATGNYEIIVKATDLCGESGFDTILVEVDVNVPPIMSPLRDSTIYLCYPGLFVWMPMYLTRTVTW